MNRSLLAKRREERTDIAMSQSRRVTMNLRKERTDRSLLVYSRSESKEGKNRQISVCIESLQTNKEEPMARYLFRDAPNLWRKGTDRSLFRVARTARIADPPEERFDATKKGREKGKQSQKRYIVSGSLCLTIFIEV